MLNQALWPKVECVESNQQYGRFVVESLERGFGITLGNALRRILLSFLPGAAVTWIKIEGVDHEFTTVKYMKEDTLEFMQNIKAIRLKALSDRPGKLMLEVTGSGVIRAADIKPSADFEIVNPDLALATLDSSEAKLSVELNVEPGKGYIQASRSDGLPVGAIPLDSIFTPIRKVNYKVEPGVGRESNFERLTLEVWTDTTITPVDAVSKAAQIMMEYLNLFTDLAKVSMKAAERQLLRRTLPPEQFEKPVTELGFSTRTINCLRRGTINTLGELLAKTEDDLNQLRHFGQKSREELLQRLKEMGHSLMPSERVKKEEAQKPKAITDLEKLKEIGPIMALHGEGDEEEGEEKSEGQEESPEKTEK